MTEAYTVQEAERVTAFIEDHVSSARVFQRIRDCEYLIGDFPGIGKVYDPDYPASRPAVPCRFLAVTNTPFTLFYRRDEDARLCTIIDIVYSASDPRKRFMMGDESYED